jgi:hypothetical protein
MQQQLTGQRGHLCLPTQTPQSSFLRVTVRHELDHGMLAVQYITLHQQLQRHKNGTQHLNDSAASN